MKQTIARLKHGDPIPEGEPRRHLGSNGYMRLRWTVSPYRVIECYEHRFVMGVPPDDVQVHHRNGDKLDNRPENLEVVTPAAHSKEHRVIDRERVAEMYRAGQSTVAIAAALGHDPASIQRALVAAGVPRRSISEALLCELDENELTRLYHAGVRPPAIAKQLGVSTDAIRRRMRLLGLPAHRPGRPAA